MNYSTGKIHATYYEAYIKTLDGKMFTPAIMGELLSLNDLIVRWGLDKEDVDWYVVYGVDMHQREAKTVAEQKLGYGFDYTYFEIGRNGNVPTDFKYRNLNIN